MKNTEKLPYILTLVVAIAGVTYYKLYLEDDAAPPPQPISAIEAPEPEVTEPADAAAATGSAAQSATAAAAKKTVAATKKADATAKKPAAATTAAAAAERGPLPLRPLSAAQKRHIAAETQCEQARDLLLQGNYAQALKLYQQALPIFEKEEGKSTNTAAIYNNIGEIYRHQHKYNEALKWHQKALTIRERELGTDNPATGESYNNIALIQDARGNYQKALDGYQKDLAITEKAHGSDSPDVATTYGNIGTTHFKHGDYTQALEWYQKAYKILLPSLGETHAQTRAVRIDMEAAYKKAKNTKPFDEWLAETQS
jgi:tetratricopeptide (TPR) repeat protein